MEERLADDELATLDLVNDEVAARLARLELTAVRVEGKAAIMIAGSVAASQFLLSRHGNVPLTVLGLSLYAVALVCGLLIATMRTFEDLSPRTLADYHDSPKSDVLRTLVATRVEIFEFNHAVYQRRTRYWRGAMVFVTAGLAVSSTAVIIGR